MHRESIDVHMAVPEVSPLQEPLELVGRLGDDDAARFNPALYLGWSCRLEPVTLRRKAEDVQRLQGNDVSGASAP